MIIQLTQTNRIDTIIATGEVITPVLLQLSGGWWVKPCKVAGKSRTKITNGGDGCSLIVNESYEEVKAIILKAQEEQKGMQ